MHMWIAKLTFQSVAFHGTDLSLPITGSTPQDCFQFILSLGQFRVTCALRYRSQIKARVVYTHSIYRADFTRFTHGTPAIRGKNHTKKKQIGSNISIVSNLHGSRNLRYRSSSITEQRTMVYVYHEQSDRALEEQSDRIVRGEGEKGRKDYVRT